MLKELCQQTITIVQEVGAFIQSEKDKVQTTDIVRKDKNDLVSYVDKESEKRLIEGLQTLLPDSSFLVEEGTIARTNNEYEWIIDPLDGTTNFLHGIPPYAISVGLSHLGKMVMGVVLELNSNECFYAWKDGGAYLNENKINVSPTPTLADSIVSTGFPYKDFSFLPQYTDLLKHLLQNVRAMRRHGAASIDLCYVACGRFDAFFEFNLAAWDIAAGSFIIQEAGGQVQDVKGTNDYIFGKSIIASNG